MEFDFGKLAARERYKLLVGLVVPRPIAFITTVGGNGVVNAAPYSFFNVLGDDPPIVIVSIEDRGPGRPKDTARNILASGEFVVNMVDETIAASMHACSEDYPPEVSELDAVGLHAAASRSVAPPRIAEAPVAFECRLHKHVELPRRHLFIGEVLWLHARENIIDPKTLRVNFADYRPVGRLFANRYLHTGDHFTIKPRSVRPARTSAVKRDR